jgi:diguanylate cyclase (GGDEF)-like protein
MYGSVSDLISIDLANAILFFSFGVTWTGARVFDHRAPLPVYLLIGPLLWFFVSHIPAFTENLDLRVLLSCGIIATYTWLTAYEFWRGRSEPLVSRWPAIFLLFANGSLFLLRTPMASMLPWLSGGHVLESVWLIVMTFESLLFTISIAFILLAMAKERAEYRLRTAAMVDSLTGIANRRAFLQGGTELTKRHAANPCPTAVLLIDLDHFKSINDRFGHNVGDEALRVFAQVIRKSMRTSDVIGRLGGEEFAAILAEPTDVTAVIAERVRTNFEVAGVTIAGNTMGATVSIGAATAADVVTNIDALIARADAALYRAKGDGRNRLHIAADEAPAERARLIAAARLGPVGKLAGMLRRKSAA